MSNISFAFFGTDHFAVCVLNQLEKDGLMPKVIIAVPDKPQGKKQTVIEAPTKIWAKERNIEVLQPEKLNTEFVNVLSQNSYEVFIVASYGKIIPQTILDIPKRKTLNIHPSLLPQYRGSSPLENAILHSTKTGVSVMRLDDKMDHGPILAQKECDFVLPVQRNILEERLAEEGGKLLGEILEAWISGTLPEREQNHSQASYTEKIKKEDGLLDLSKPFQSYKKILAYYGWPGTYFFSDKNNKKIRVLVTEADFTNEKLLIKKVKPEGKKEMSYEDFLRG
ncbi:MAG: hypothetical protein RJA61_531 [Candidatus Parcubacteria bacterium]|jgi:methionyl-tRNA formyltransferase